MDRSHLNNAFKLMAARLFRQGMVKNGDPRSWHSHYLRHSFETEVSHAGVKAEVRDFFMGHIEGIQWTCNHRNELHEEDLVKEYREVEPFVSLAEIAATLKGTYEAKEMEFMTQFLDLKGLNGQLRAELE